MICGASDSPAGRRQRLGFSAGPRAAVLPLVLQLRGAGCWKMQLHIGDGSCEGSGGKGIRAEPARHSLCSNLLAREANERDYCEGELPARFVMNCLRFSIRNRSEMAVPESKLENTGPPMKPLQRATGAHSVDGPVAHVCVCHGLLRSPTHHLAAPSVERGAALFALVLCCDGASQAWAGW